MAVIINGDTGIDKITDGSIQTADFASGVATNTPMFSVTLSSGQSITSLTWTKVQFDTKSIDTDSVFDATTNYRFTVPSGKAGKYMINAAVRVSSGVVSGLSRAFVRIYKNGVTIDRQGGIDFRNSPVVVSATYCNTILDLAEGDYLEVYALGQATTTTISPTSDGATLFSAHRLLG